MLRDRFQSHFQKFISNLRFVRKMDSPLMRFLGKILFFVPDFMTRYSTTIGANKIYVAEAVWSIPDDPGNISLYAHEYTHCEDRKRLGALTYSFLWLFPQILVLGALLSLLAIWFSSAWLWALVCLVFILPWPAPGRYYLERRGYEMSLACESWVSGNPSNPLQAWATAQFTGPSYYWMWPFKKQVARNFAQHMIRVSKQEFPSKFYDNVVEFLVKEKIGNLNQEEK